MEHEKMREVLIQNDYGGFELSKDLMVTRDAIVASMKKDNPSMTQEEEEALKEDRYGEATIQAFHVLGSKKSSGSCSSIASVSIPAFMVHYFDPHEYDGWESVDFDVSQFWKDVVERETDPSMIVAEMNIFLYHYENRRKFIVSEKE